MDGMVFGYNFLYKTSIRIPTRAFPVIDHYLSEPKLENSLPSHYVGGDPWLRILKEAGFVIESNLDELNLIRFRYNQNLFSNENLHLVILPTLWCNFDCSYCFEFKEKKFLGKELGNDLVAWFDKRFRNKRAITVHWFGGEPLLAKEIIINMTEQFKAFCNEIGAVYNAGLTTNGYLLDQKFIDMLNPLNIETVHVTLDGDEKAHDNLRRKRNSGEGTFSQIYENIIKFCKTETSTQLILRLNCCDENYEGIAKMLDYFPNIVRERALIYFRWVFANEASGNRDFSCAQRGELPYLGLSKLYEEAIELGWRTTNPTQFEFYGHCLADFTDFYFIDPDGNVFLCPKSFMSEDSAGSIVNGDLKLKNTGDYYDWYAANPFNDQECMECKILPMCCGGCRKKRVAGCRGCLEEKEALDLFVRNLIRQKNHNSLREL